MLHLKQLLNGLPTNHNRHQRLHQTLLKTKRDYW
ncbi:unnamed protein product, partial [Larinioides sclopetarius]